MLNKIKTFLNKPITININIHNKYSWNLLSIFGWIYFSYYNFIFLLDKSTAAGIGLFFFIIIFYPITFIIFLLILLIENLAKLSIKNENVVNKKIYKILRYIGLVIWFYPIVGLLICAILSPFSTYN